ncbi:5-bromo-4-chloroindolyl phosphate hydrolysis family protein [Brachyspira pilosicoli]|uniref:5-bromo-4-chloroindolyl phosphate hydrolysis family protein n=1 Tax=Brachyspira pilosicoli TaxID=52584 RepID=A0AAJ6GD37_BRAPL|nr:5-bromo-4-chloroindolyl phosphate hydrolysis family protein [Brachyspira pilosicoli]WIH90186.1 5-bromo-4-chloroindolyl phosphate hydrolysis family protein [Brachyspira pilosicoli]WIH92477.1 5-bromo-4-chloroindolyl phosphate hydrolysis family protein [Brachyspira pilosicoli]WIH94769.1 5-bromo-4-chloroindolyl phosphate hydrolysis family protein [Brachyspira pilosicoli]
MEEDKYILEKLKLNLDRNFPVENDNHIDNDKEYSNNNFNNSNDESLVILETKRNIEKIKEYSKEINDADINPALEEMISILDNMVLYSKANKEGEKKLQKINEYHLPTAIKMLKYYIDFCNLPVKNTNIEKTSLEIEDAIIKLNEALKKMLLEMNENKLIDINSDIDVLKNMLEKDGLI